MLAQNFLSIPQAKLTDLWVSSSPWGDQQSLHASLKSILEVSEINKGGLQGTYSRNQGRGVALRAIFKGVGKNATNL